VTFLTEALGEAPGDAMMAALYRLADAMILPSYEEGFGLPVLEAAIARLPVVCASIPALRELGGEEAAYFPPQTAPEVVANLLHQALASSPAFRLRRRALDCFDWHQVVRRCLIPLLENDG
jgi:glycosyltransferase involved in cell wall biosynthesis